MSVRYNLFSAYSSPYSCWILFKGTKRKERKVMKAFISDTIFLLFAWLVWSMYVWNLIKQAFIALQKKQKKNWQLSFQSNKKAHPKKDKHITLIQALQQLLKNICFTVCLAAETAKWAADCETLKECGARHCVLVYKGYDWVIGVSTMVSLTVNLPLWTESSSV